MNPREPTRGKYSRNSRAPHPGSTCEGADLQTADASRLCGIRILRGTLDLLRCGSYCALTGFQDLPASLVMKALPERVMTWAFWSPSALTRTRSSLVGLETLPQLEPPSAVLSRIPSWPTIHPTVALANVTSKRSTWTPLGTSIQPRSESKRWISPWPPTRHFGW